MSIGMQEKVTSPAGADAPARPKLKRSLGLWMATALVIGNMVGSGVFGLPASLASTGPISLLAWGFTGVGALLLALVFANLGRAYPQTGGPYAYARRAFGDFAGFWTAWGYWIAAWAGNAAIAVIFVSYGSVFWPRLATDNVAGLRRRPRGHLAAHDREHRRRARDRHRPAGDDGPEVRAARADRPHRALLHAQRQLHALRSQPRLARRPLARDLVRRDAHAVGVPRPRVGHDPGRGGQGSRADAAARHDRSARPRRPGCTCSRPSRSWASSPPRRCRSRTRRSPTPRTASSAPRCSACRRPRSSRRWP